MATDSGVFDDKCRQALRSAINGRRQTGRSGPDYDEIARPLLPVAEIEPDRSRQIKRGGPFERALPAQHDVEPGATEGSACRDSRQVARIIGIKPTIRDAVAVGELEQA